MEKVQRFFEKKKHIYTYLSVKGVMTSLSVHPKNSF